MIRPLYALFRRELSLARRQASDVAVVVIFFVLAVSLFPFAIGPEPNLLARVASGIVWAIALLAALLPLDQLFAPDVEDGSLDLLAQSRAPLVLLVAVKMLAHWITSGLPLVLVAPLLAIMLRLPADGLGTLVAAMALGTPVLSSLGAIGAALTVGARRASGLVPLIVLPWALPVLIFGVGSVEAQVAGLGGRQMLYILAAIFCLAVPLGPVVATFGLRQALR